MYLSWHGYWPKKKANLRAPIVESTREISVVIPVRDNQSGINLFFRHFFQTHLPEMYPLEIIIIDNSNSPIHLPRKVKKFPLDIKVLRCEKMGPASARNLGWQKAKGEWILFTDSDCIPSSQWIEGYLSSMNGAIGYAGNVKPHGDDVISRYYDNQDILIPSRFINNGIAYPDYVITANTLLWKRALELIGGFNETIKIAAGEDIDVGFRLRELGDLSFAPHSLVYHNFEDGLLGFIKRFKRYGKGNRLLSEIYSLDMRPRDIKPRNRPVLNSLLALIQYYCLLWGYNFS